MKRKLTSSFSPSSIKLYIHCTYINHCHDDCQERDSLKLGHEFGQSGLRYNRAIYTSGGEIISQQIIKPAHMQKFSAECFDNPKEAHNAANILKSIIDSRSPRISNTSQAMTGHHEANYKAIQRFLDSSDTKRALNRLLWEEAPFILADPTDIARRQAK